jgi:hypothetical protein
MVGVTGSIPVVPTIQINDLDFFIDFLFSSCPSFAQRILFVLRSGDRASDARKFRE